MNWINAKTEYFPIVDIEGFYVLSFSKRVILKEKYWCEPGFQKCFVQLSWSGVYKLQENRVKNVYAPNIETLKLDAIYVQDFSECFENHVGIIDFYNKIGVRFYKKLVAGGNQPKASLNDLTYWFKLN